MRKTRNGLELEAKRFGLHIETYSHGDGFTRYRFFNSSQNYGSGSEMYTALGTKEAWTYLTGFIQGRDYQMRL